MGWFNFDCHKLSAGVYEGNRVLVRLFVKISEIFYSLGDIFVMSDPVSDEGAHFHIGIHGSARFDIVHFFHEPLATRAKKEGT